MKYRCLALFMVLLMGCSCGEKEYPQEIAVVVRENGSGTRWAFNEMLGLYDKGDDGSYYDTTTVEATVVNKTDVMLTTISGDVNSIGYSSLATLTEGVKWISIDGISPSKENILSETYTLKRPFIFIAKDCSPLAEDFLNFVTAQQGQLIIASDFIACYPLATPFTSNGAEGKLVIGGSSSVYPLAEKLAEEYMAINPKGKIELQGSDSSTAILATQDGIYDIGMISRAPTPEEESKLQIITVAYDSMVMIVHEDNPLDNMGISQARDIFTGILTKWEQVLDYETR